MFTLICLLVLFIDSISCSVTQDKYLLKINRQVEEFIMGEEGFRSKPYLCSGGVLTVGFGTRAKNKNDVIDEKEAQKRLNQYLNDVTYKKIEKYNLKLNKNQMIAATSFDYNTGRLEEIIKGDTIDCKKLLKYNKVKVHGKYKIDKGLEKRRQKEYKLCMKN